MSSVKIFPLPAIQLFPHALLPLHVFEPRYRKLVADAIASDNLIGMPRYAPDANPDDARPAVSPVFGVGRIVAHTPLPDGRSNILLAGLYRARIEYELPQRDLYREVAYEKLDDTVAADPSSVDALRALADELAARIPEGGPALRSLVREHNDAAALADVLTAATVGDPTARQSFLETLDAHLRVERIAAHLGAALRHFSDKQSN
jgi:Lon protease-like protein